MAYKLTINSVVSDGTNYYFSTTVDDGVHALPPITATFPLGSTQADVDTYMQAIVNNAPTLAREIAELAGKTYTGA